MQSFWSGIVANRWPLQRRLLRRGTPQRNIDVASRPAGALEYINASRGADLRALNLCTLP